MVDWYSEERGGCRASAREACDFASARFAPRTQVGVLGGGAWGTALAIHCARMGHEVMIWARWGPRENFP